MVKFNWNRLASIASYRRNGTNRDCGSNRRHLYRQFWSWSFGILGTPTEQDRKRRAFFRWQEKYEQHSKDLGKALYEWYEGQKLTYCEYKDGHYESHPSLMEIPYSRIRNLKYAVEHKEKSHPEIDQNLSQIELKNYELCDKIQSLMDLCYVNSFEDVIATKIRTAISVFNNPVDNKQDLEGSKNKTGYIRRSMFKVIFYGVDNPHKRVTLVKEIQIHPITDKPKGNNNQTYYKLEWQNDFLAMASSEQLLSELKQVMIKLFSDNELELIVDRYIRTHNEQRINMREVRELADKWSAGNLELPEGEGNYPVCDGCPAKPDVEER